ncbi:hypothetical protein GCM10022268_16820 [Sphingomonas cynarae]|uniref:Ice-binding protein C-terminal domain-containing protein n=1 Tax=Sphingomonas cynarae TaxID=930197 RepID=A0ABP7DQF9_9SPHN
MRNTLITAAIAAAAFAMPASAATIVSTGGAFAAPAGSVTIDFNSAVAAPFTAAFTNASLVQGNLAGFYAQPGFSDGSRYASVFRNGNLTLTSQLALRSVSFFVGSIDIGNIVELLSSTGSVVGRFSGAAFSTNADGDQGSMLTNRRVTISLTEGEASFAGVRFISAQNSFEIDNVVFAVPEASTWALMLVGFGMVGAATRYRRRKTNVAFS